jgi:hypothetical protein
MSRGAQTQHETARSMKRVLGWTAFALIGTMAAWQGASALQNAAAPKAATEKKAEAPKPKADPKPVAAPKPATAATAPKPGAAPAKPKAVTFTGKAETPMKDRVATLGLLNKRNGQWRDLTMKPGEGIRIGDVVVRLRACETTASWEQEQWTGAFVQVISRQANQKWLRAFSGWLYKESPSLNVVEHPIYDVWVKDCQMRHPEVGPDTIIARGDEPSRAAKRGEED